MSSPPCAGHTQAIDTFVTESTDTLSARPESMEEIGAANAKCSHIVSRKSEVRRAPLGERPSWNIFSFNLSVEMLYHYVVRHCADPAPLHVR